MNLVPLAKVKERIGLGATDTDDDDLMRTILANISGRVEDFLNRECERGTYTEYFDVEPYRRVVSLRGIPIASITSVVNSQTWDWTTTAVDSSLYTAHANLGLVKFYNGALLDGLKALEITYVGGMATDEDQFYELYPSLAEAVLNQVCYEYSHRDSIGMTTQTAPGGASTSFSAGGEFLTAVERVLRRYRRHAY